MGSSYHEQCALADKIRKYWREHGYFVFVKVEEYHVVRNGKTITTYELRSNLKNGLPV